MEVGPVHVWQHFEKVMPLGITQWGKQKMWNAVFWGCVFLFDPWYLWHVVFFDDLIQTPWRIMLPLAQVKKEPRRRSAMWSEEGSTVDQHHEKHPWTYEKWFLGIGDPQNHRRIWMIWIICGYQHFRKPPLSGSVNWALERCSTFRRPGPVSRSLHRIWKAKPGCCPKKGPVACSQHQMVVPKEWSWSYFVIGDSGFFLKHPSSQL